ncbi:tape measure protein [Clostridioides difficile]|uniref:tape measure protein n=3 Tax=Clostridioides difficile TaxID=1496 RepID=UPI00038C75E9|nr:tape measure protein [Clostridioides difficile]EQE56568.1 tape measure domain protein [Clostridioides difficile CD42]EQF30613.1 tape measure domain protein [Clostridioides difficile CD165]EQG13473.1 tape measure domain protein [Clostridioides difficile DA00044]EQG69113.1 tape measure domain protein [Clostridioides difficile DA00154]EQG85415.1 tape measure domain protein [Clostridioides difficile DA00183]
MATIQTSIKIFDGMTPAFRNMTNSINTTINSLERLQQRLHNPLNTGGIQTSQQSLNNIESILTRIEQKIGRNANEQENFNNSIKRGSEASSVLVSRLKNIAGMYIGIKGIESITRAADTIASTKARLNLMNDGLQTTEQLNKMIYLSAQSARASYADTAAQVSKLGILAGDAFGSSAEVVKFAELMNKSFVIGGTSASEASAAMYQLTQAMAAGKLQGDEFRSIMENAPLLAEKIAQSMGKGKEALKDLSRTGAITADVVRNALFKASAEIEKKFESMPITFSQALVMMKNDAYMIFGQTLGKISGALQSVRFSEIVVSMRNVMIAISSNIYDTLNIIKNILNSDFFSDFVQGITLGAVLIIQGLGGITNAALSVVNIFAQNWSIIAPIVYGVIAAIGIYTIATIALAVANKVASLSASWFNFQMTQTVIMHELATGVTWMQVAAQYGLNAALYACPLTWIVLGFIAVIAVVFMVVAAINHFAGTSLTALGVIVGAVFAAVATIQNIMIGLLNGCIFVNEAIANGWNQCVYLMKQAIAKGVIFIIEKMASLNDSVNSAGNALGKAFIDGANIAIRGVNKLIDLLNKIPGIDIGKVGEATFTPVKADNSYIKQQIDSLNRWVGNAPEKITLERMGYKNIGAAFEKGNALGTKWQNAISNKLKDTFDINKMLEDAKDKLGLKDLWDKNKYGLDNGIGSSDLGKSAKDTAGNTAKMAKTMDKSQEDLKYLRDIAEQEVINRFTGVNIKIDMNNTNNINSEADVDGIVNVLTEKLNDAMVVSAEGIV